MRRLPHSGAAKQLETGPKSAWSVGNDRVDPPPPRTPTPRHQSGDGLLTVEFQLATGPDTSRSALAGLPIDCPEGEGAPTSLGQGPRGASTLGQEVSVREEPLEPGLVVVTPDEALQRARPLPAPQDLVITDVPDAEWEAFQKALAER
jgi:hypothetical protein